MSKPTRDTSLEAHSACCLRLRQQLDDIKRAEGPSEQARNVAKAYVEAVHSYQRAKYGRVRFRVVVAKLLR